MLSSLLLRNEWVTLAGMQGDLLNIVTEEHHVFNSGYWG